MTLMNFDTELDKAGTVRIITRASTPLESVVVTARPIASRTDVLVPESSWSWENLRDYVVSSIEHRFGPFPRNKFKEDAIFKSFVERWGEQAVAIAQSAFDAFDGYWHSAPISINRFCVKSDPYFAAVIAERLSA